MRDAEENESDAAPSRTDAVATADQPEGPPSDVLVLRRRPMWPFFAVVAAIGLVIAGGIYWFVSRPDPFKVLVAVDVDGQWWEGSRAAAILADQIGEGLKKIGFEPVSGGDPEVDKILSSSKTPEEAARRLGAGFLITGSLSPQLIEHKVEGEAFVEARSDAKLQVRFIGDPDGEATDVPVAAHGFGVSKDAALAVLVDRISERVFDAAVPKVLEHEVIKSKLDEGDLNATVRLKEAKQYVDLRARRIDLANKAYDKADQDHAEHAGAPRPITYLGSFNETSYLAATSADRVLLLSADVSPFVHPVSMDLVWSYRLERLAWRGMDRKDEGIWTGYHVLGLPAASADGSTIAFVEDLFGRAKTLSVVREGGAPIRLRVDAKARFDDLVISRAGSFVAFYERPCIGCGSNFSLVSLADGKQRYGRTSAVPGDERRMSESYYGFTWLDDHQLIIGVKDENPPPVEPIEDEDGDETIADDPKRGGEEIRVVDVSKQPPLERLLTQLETDEVCFGPDASPDGKVVAMTCSGKLALFDTSTGEQSVTSEPASDPTWSPDGKKIAFIRGGDVHLMTVSDKSVTALTTNEFAENRPRFSPDGKRLYFQSQQNDPNIDRRISSVVASVEVP